MDILEWVITGALFIFTFLDMAVKEEGAGVCISSIGKIELKNLSFQYGNGNYALKSVNMING